MRPIPTPNETLIKYLKNHHQQQLDKLLVKNQLEIDIVEDIRNFVKQKCNLDKNYAEGLLKLSTNFQNRKIPNIPNLEKPQSLDDKVVNTIATNSQRRISLTGDFNSNGKQVTVTIGNKLQQTEWKILYFKETFSWYWTWD